MKTKQCDRLWQAEALDEGRLGDDHRASFQRHAEGCTVCRDELRAIRAFRERARAWPVSSRTELEHRRRREQLLSAANASVAATRRVRAPLVLACAVALLVATFALRSSRRAPTVAAPHYQVVDVDGARVITVDAGPATRVSLEHGTARFVVDHLLPAQHFVVSLPDGEIEVRGTSFTVRVDHVTEDVRVDEGLVALRVDGVEHLLAAGTSWRRSHVAAVPAAAAPPSASASSAPPVPKVSSAPASDGGVLFADAMKAFQDKNYSRADAFFSLFATTFKTDSRVEDALFLRAVCASRRGDNAGAATLARAYLDAYPAGFHVADARKLADP